MRSAVVAAIAGATMLAGAPAAVAAAPMPAVAADGAASPGLPLEPIDLSAGTGSAAAVDTGSSGGATTTGSSGTGSATALESLLFGGPLLCAAVGSAINRNLTCPGTPGPNIP